MIFINIVDAILYIFFRPAIYFYLVYYFFLLFSRLFQRIFLGGILLRFSRASRPYFSPPLFYGSSLPPPALKSPLLYCLCLHLFLFTLPLCPPVRVGSLAGVRCWDDDVACSLEGTQVRSSAGEGGDRGVKSRWG